MRETISNSSFPYPNKPFSPRKNHGAEICVNIFLCANVPHSPLQTKFKPILFSGECYMGKWDMKVGAVDPHHREIQANMS